MIIGSNSAWLMLDGMMARPRAISSRTNSGGDESRQFAAELFAVLQRGIGAIQHLLAAEIFALGDVNHFLGDDSRARGIHIA